jgi:hypothetical protein
MRFTDHEHELITSWAHVALMTFADSSDSLEDVLRAFPSAVPDLLRARYPNLLQGDIWMDREAEADFVCALEEEVRRFLAEGGVVFGPE